MAALRAGRCRTKSNKKVAIKHIDRVFEVREDALRIVRELRFLRLLKHANVRTIVSAYSRYEAGALRA